MENGGVGAAVIKSALGNSLGVQFAMSADELYAEGYGDLIVSLKDETALCGCISKKWIGQVCGENKNYPLHTHLNKSLPLSFCLRDWRHIRPLCPFGTRS